MAIAFGGLLTPPGTFKGMLVKKKEYLFSFRHSFASASRSNSSPNESAESLGGKVMHDWPIGIPHPPSRYSWQDTSPGVGYT